MLNFKRLIKNEYIMTGNMTAAKKAEIRKISSIEELKNMFFTLFNDKFYALHGGAQTVDILNNVRLIDSISIDNLIFTALFGVRGENFLGVLSQVDVRKKSYDERMAHANSLNQTLSFVQKEDYLGVLVDLFFMYPDGSNKKLSTMKDILNEYYGRKISISQFFGSYDSGFYEIFGVKSFSSVNKDEVVNGIDNITIDTYVYECLSKKSKKPASYLDFQGVLCGKRKKIYNLRKKISSKELSSAHNLIDRDLKMTQTLRAFKLAPKWSTEKDRAIILLLKLFYDIDAGGQKNK